VKTDHSHFSPIQALGKSFCPATGSRTRRFASHGLISPQVTAYRVLAPVHGGPALADLPRQVKDPPDRVEEAQAAPRAAFLGLGCCAQLAAESFQYQPAY